MLSNDRIYKELSDEEGVQLEVYKCSSNHLTVGIGHNLDADPVDHLIGRHLKLHDTITKYEMTIIFNRDVESMMHLLDKYLSWWRDLPTFAQYVILSICFNIGIGGKISTNPIRYNGLRGFPNTLACFQSHDWEGAARGLENSRWYNQVGRRSKKLCEMLRTGKFPDGKSE